MRTRALIVFGLALAVRLGYVFVAGKGPAFPDETRLWSEILHFSEHFSMTERSVDMPMLPVLFGLAHRFIGLTPLGVQVFHCLASAATVLVVMDTAEELDAAPLSGLLAGVGAALYPYLVFFSGTILTESLFLLLLCGAFLLHLRGRIVPFFLCLGLAQLTRPTVLYFLPVAAVWTLLVRPPSLDIGAAGKKVLAGLAVFFLLLTPWAARNMAVHGVFMLGKPSGHPLWEGNNPWNMDGGVKRQEWTTTEIPGWGVFYSMPPGLSYIQEEQWMTQRALRFIKENPGRFLGLCVKRFVRFWSPWPNDPAYASGIYKWVSLLSFGPVLLLALASLWLLRDRLRRTGLLWLFVGYYTAIHVILIGSIRYRLPLDPLLIALAAAGLARLIASRAAPERHA